MPSVTPPPSPHTPGPWAVDLAQYPGRPWIYTILTQPNDASTASALERQANARLIGNAPVLLQACRDALRLFLLHKELLATIPGFPELADELSEAARRATGY